MARTDVHGFLKWAAGLSQFDVTFNDLLNLLERKLGLAVLSRVLTAPPGGETGGERYIMPAGALTGAWSGFAENDVAIFQDGGWIAGPPADGQGAWDLSAGEGLTFTTAGGWQITSADLSAYVKVTDIDTLAELNAIIAAADIQGLGIVKANLTATAAPTVDDDSGEGYSVGSSWWDVTNDQIYFCVDATVGAAVWRQLGSGSGGGMTVTEVKTGAYTANANEVVPVDSTAGAFDITMPGGPAAQDRVIVIDVGRYCSTNPVGVLRNGNNLLGLAQDHSLNQDGARIDAAFDGTDNWDGHLIGTRDFRTGYMGVNAQTGTTYEFTAADLYKQVTANNASASTYDIPDDLGAIGDTIHLLNLGAGTVTITASGTDTLDSSANDCAQGVHVEMVKLTGSSWFVKGGS